MSLKAKERDASEVPLCSTMAPLRYSAPLTRVPACAPRAKGYRAPRWDYLAPVIHLPLYACSLPEFVQFEPSSTPQCSTGVRSRVCSTCERPSCSTSGLPGFSAPLAFVLRAPSPDLPSSQQEPFRSMHILMYVHVFSTKGPSTSSAMGRPSASFGLEPRTQA